MTRLTLDAVRDALPDLDELRPLFDHLLAGSEPDRARMWAGSGRLGTVGSRLVGGDLSREELEGLTRREAARLGKLYAHVGGAVAALASENAPSAAHHLLEAAALEEVGDRPDRAAAYTAAAYRAARGERDQRPAVLALRRWARACRALGQLVEAHQRYASAHEAALAMGDSRGAAEAAIGAGNVLEEQGRWSDAERWYKQALEAVAGLDEPVPETRHAQLNLHIVTRSAGSIDESLAWLALAEEAAAAVDPSGAAPFMAHVRGQLEMSRGAHEAAERHLREALEGKTDPRARVGFRLNLAEALLAQGRALDAAEHAREAERDAIRAGLVPKLPEVYRLLGRIASMEGDEDAFVLFERALEIVRDRGLPALEEALTLQAYAASEARRGEAEASEQLLHEARERFTALGMTGMRQEWADVYGAAHGDTTSLPKEEKKP